MGWHSDAEAGLGQFVASWSLGSDAIMSWRCKDDKQTILKLVLQHGDVLIMDGVKLQQLYQHKVDPKGFRFAATARNINVID